MAEQALADSEDASARDGIARLVRVLGGLGATPSAKVVARVDSSTRGAASQTVDVVVADGTAGDTLTLRFPSYGQQSTFSAVATGGTAASGTYSLDAGSNTLAAQELRDAINADALASRLVVATESSGTVTITALEAGSWAHEITLKKDVTTGTALALGAATLAGGDDVLDQPTETVTFNTDTNALAGDDTVSVGSVTFTWKASPSGENQIDISAVDATAASNFAAAVNAHSKLQGVVDAEAASGVVTLTYKGNPREGELLLCQKSETNAGAMTFGNSGVFAAGTTQAYESTARIYGSRGAA